jgi:hypothetical protein
MISPWKRGGKGMSISIDFGVLRYSFIHKPLLVGGKSMEYYGLRKAGSDIDLILHVDDHMRLRRKYPDHVKDLYGDIGICEFGFEMWNHICNFDYGFLGEKAIEEQEFLVISLEKALLLKAIAMQIPKYHKDLELIAELIRKKAYGEA